MSKEPKEPKPFTTGRKPKLAKELEAIIANQKVMLENQGKQTQVLKGHDERIKTLEDSMASIVGALQERSAPAQPGQPQTGTGNPVADAIIGKVMGGGETPMKMAVDLAKSFNKVYMTGQSHMLRMVSLMTRGKKLSELFPGEGEGESEE